MRTTCYSVLWLLALVAVSHAQTYQHGTALSVRTVKVDPNDMVDIVVSPISHPERTAWLQTKRGWPGYYVPMAGDTGEVWGSVEDEIMSVVFPAGCVARPRDECKLGTYGIRESK
jgi:hypothetical protein